MTENTTPPRTIEAPLRRPHCSILRLLNTAEFADGRSIQTLARLVPQYPGDRPAIECEADVRTLEDLRLVKRIRRTPAAPLEVVVLTPLGSTCVDLADADTAAAAATPKPGTTTLRVQWAPACRLVAHGLLDGPKTINELQAWGTTEKRRAAGMPSEPEHWSRSAISSALKVLADAGFVGGTVYVDGNRLRWALTTAGRDACKVEPEEPSSSIVMPAIVRQRDELLDAIDNLGMVLSNGNERRRDRIYDALLKIRALRDRFPR